MHTVCTVQAVSTKRLYPQGNALPTSHPGPSLSTQPLGPWSVQVTVTPGPLGP